MYVFLLQYCYPTICDHRNLIQSVLLPAEISDLKIISNFKIGIENPNNKSPKTSFTNSDVFDINKSIVNIIYTIINRIPSFIERTVYYQLNKTLISYGSYEIDQYYDINQILSNPELKLFKAFISAKQIIYIILSELNIIFIIPHIEKKSFGKIILIHNLKEIKILYKEEDLLKRKFDSKFKRKDNLSNIVGFEFTFKKLKYLEVELEQKFKITLVNFIESGKIKLGSEYEIFHEDIMFNSLGHTNFSLKEVFENTYTSNYFESNFVYLRIEYDSIIKSQSPTKRIENVKSRNKTKIDNKNKAQYNTMNIGQDKLTLDDYAKLNKIEEVDKKMSFLKLSKKTSNSIYYNIKGGLLSNENEAIYNGLSINNSLHKTFQTNEKNQLLKESYLEYDMENLTRILIHKLKIFSTNINFELDNSNNLDKSLIPIDLSKYDFIIPIDHDQIDNPLLDKINLFGKIKFLIPDIVYLYQILVQVFSQLNSPLIEKYVVEFKKFIELSNILKDQNNRSKSC